VSTLSLRERSPLADTVVAAAATGRGGCLKKKAEKERRCDHPSLFGRPGDDADLCADRATRHALFCHGTTTTLICARSSRFGVRVIEMSVSSVLRSRNSLSTEIPSQRPRIKADTCG